VTLYERLTTQSGGKLALALRVEPENAPLGVTRHLFGVTKLHSSCLDWCLFRFNSDDSTSVNRPSVNV